MGSNGVVIASVCLTLVVFLAMLITAVVAYLLWTGAVWWLDTQAKQARHLRPDEDGRWSQSAHQTHQQLHSQPHSAGSMYSAPNQQQGPLQMQPDNSQQQMSHLQTHYPQQQQPQHPQQELNGSAGHHMHHQLHQLHESQLPQQSMCYQQQQHKPSQQQQQQQQPQPQPQQQQHQQKQQRLYGASACSSPTRAEDHRFPFSSMSLAEMTPERTMGGAGGAGGVGGGRPNFGRKTTGSLSSASASASDFQDRCVEVQMAGDLASASEDLDMLDVEDRSSTAGRIQITRTDENRRTQSRQPANSGTDRRDAPSRNYTAQEVQRGYAAQLSMKFGGDQFFHIDNVDVVADIFNLSKEDLCYCALCLEEVGNSEGGAALRLKKWGTGSFSARVWTLALARFVKSAQKTRGAKDVVKVTRSCEQWQYRAEHFQRELETCEAIFQRKFGTALLFAFQDNSIREGELQRALQTLGESGRSTAPRRSRLALPASSASASTGIASKESRPGRASTSSSARPTLEDEPAEDPAPARLRKRTSTASNSGANAVDTAGAGAEAKRRRQSRN